MCEKGGSRSVASFSEKGDARRKRGMDWSFDRGSSEGGELLTFRKGRNE